MESWSLYLFFIIMSIIANVLLLFAMYNDSLKCFRNPTSYFIANLGIADLLNSFFHMEELLVSQTAYYRTFHLPGLGNNSRNIWEFCFFFNFSFSDNSCFRKIFVFSRIILVYYCKCCNLIGYSTRYLFIIR